MKRFLSVLAALAILGGMAAQAGPVMSFNGQGYDGSLTYAGGATPLIGTTLDVTTVVGLSTPLNVGGAHALAITSGAFSFTTGAYTGVSNGDLMFAPGGTVGLIGVVPGTTPPIGPPPTALLFNGTFLTPVSIMNTANGAELLGTVSLTNVNAILAAYFGLPGGPGVTYTGGITIIFSVPAGDVLPATAFSSDPNAPISTTDNVSPTPEPATLGMAGTVAIAGLFYGVRRFRRGVK